MSDMQVSTRSLVRDFPSVKAAARKGRTVEVVDGRTGEVFLLTSKPTRTFGELPAEAKGVYSGPRALSAKYPQMDFCDAAVVRLSEIYP